MSPDVFTTNVRTGLYAGVPKGGYMSKFSKLSL